ncbi:MAG: NAD-dependent epimerase/dehydratase family protein [Phycisphaerales bacterium]
MHVLVTGSSGLIGSAAVEFFDDLGFDVTGIDNNMRADFFGPGGDTTWNRDRLLSTRKRFRHLELDIRDRMGVDRAFADGRFDIVIHAAAQPSHDLAASRPFDDFEVNAGGTLNLLEACRNHTPEAVFVHVSTNKVYGDGPNYLPLIETKTRYDFAQPEDQKGIAEDFPVDATMHSLFGASKLAADIMAQEYGRYFGMNVGVFRGGCLTGPAHSGVVLHGFLSHLVTTSVRGGDYTVFGYKGKQVRDQIHAMDVISAFWSFAQKPRPGEAYNLGGGKDNAASVLECVALIEELGGGRANLSFSDQARRGDHICYYTDMSKFRSHYPAWRMKYPLARIMDEMIEAARTSSARPRARAGAVAAA